MASARKLPSGSWRVSAYDYTDENGKIHRKSFTVKDPSPKGKRECERQAAEWAVKKAHEDKSAPVTVSEASEAYIASKSNVLSPSTVMGYKKIVRNNFDAIKDLRIEELTSATVQTWINAISQGHSAKTVKNAYGFLTAVVYNYTDKRFKVTLPADKQKDLTIPTDDDVKRLIEAAEGDLKVAIYLGAFAGLRRGEICALTSEDVYDGFIRINKSLGIREDRTWAVKVPKTPSSNRDVIIPDFLCEMLKSKKGRIISCNPDQITEDFKSLRDSLGLPAFRFHDLRHYYVSINHAIGIPDQYIMSMGGWSTDKTMKKVYRNTLAPERDKFAELSVSHFEGLENDIKSETTVHETVHEKIKPT